MKPLSDEHRKALEEALTTRPIGQITSRGKFTNVHQNHAYHDALLEHYGISNDLVHYKFAVLALLEHLYVTQQRLDRLEARRK